MVRASEIRLYYVPLALQCVYGCSDETVEKRVEKDGSEISGGGENGDYLTSYMQMIWF